MLDQQAKERDERQAEREAKIKEVALLAEKEIEQLALGRAKE